MGLNLAHYLDISASQAPEKTAIIADSIAISYGELARAAKRVANVLQGSGIERNDKVVMMLPNVPEFTIAYFGILNVGAVATPINVLLKSHEIEYCLEDSEAKAFIAWRGFEQEARKAFEKSSCGHFLLVDPPDTAEPCPGELSLKSLMEDAPDAFDVVQVMPDDTAVILYTSGTTGRSKGAELTHFNMFFNALVMVERVLLLKSDDVSLAILPLFHSFGQTCIQNASILAGATVSMLPAFDPKKTLAVIRRDQVTYMAAVPAMYTFLLKTSKSDESPFDSVRLAVSGGSSLPVELLRLCEEDHGLKVLEGYGLSETSPVASFNLQDRPRKPGSIGLPIWGCEMRVMKEDGTFADPGEVGEIVIRGHNLMKQYYRRDAATREAIRDGWFYSGDMARMDEDGYFFIVDRKKDVIIRGGMNVYPREIEEVLYGHPAVLEAAVVGMPKPHDQDEAEVWAFLVLKEGKEADSREVRKYCREHLADFKCPRQVKFLDALPKGPTNKILKRELRAQYINPAS